jgi:hypothetical protein
LEFTPYATKLAPINEKPPEFAVWSIGAPHRETGDRDMTGTFGL